MQHADREEPAGTSTPDRDTKPEGIPYEGEYCAEVDYYNPNTGTRSHYRLIIEAENNSLEQINFKKGHLDEDHFQTKEFDTEGRVSIITDQGYRYSVRIIGETAGCFDEAE